MSTELTPAGAELVFAGPNGEPFTSSLVIAEQTGNEHASVIKLVRENTDDLSEVGTLRFEIAKSGGRPTEFAELDEPAAALLMTYLRNNPVVKDFKKRLVAGFYAMRQRLAQIEAETRPSFDPASLTRQEILRIALNAEEERMALEAENKVLAPKAEAFDSFLDSTGKYSVGAVAKMLGTSQNKLFRDLRNRGVLIAKGAMRNTPYQNYMHHFEVRAHEYERSNGEAGCSYTTYVQPSGIDFIRRKLGLPTIDPLPIGSES